MYDEESLGSASLTAASCSATSWPGLLDMGRIVEHGKLDRDYFLLVYDGFNNIAKGPTLIFKVKVKPKAGFQRS